MNWRVVGPLFVAAGLTAIVASACAPQSVTDDSGTGGSGTSTGGTSGGAAYCHPGPQCPVDAAGVDLTTPVSFATQIFPIFQSSCILSACHIGSTPSAGNWLGPSTEEGTGDATTYQAIIHGLKGPSTVAPAMANVVPGNWQDSFLMLKLDGCQNTRGLTCEVPENDKRPGCGEDLDCGVGMPNVDKPEENRVFPLAADQRNLVRAWIAQGAQNN